jgi:hypothetical protein
VCAPAENAFRVARQGPTSIDDRRRPTRCTGPYFKVFLAAQVRSEDKGFLSRDITVRDLITHRGDVHHIFPRNYLKSSGSTRTRYNQIANYVMMQSEINIQIGDQPPSKYFSALIEACREGRAAYGVINDSEELRANLAAHAIPEGVENMSVDNYDAFLDERRRLMATKIKTYFNTL